MGRYRILFIFLFFCAGFVARGQSIEDLRRRIAEAEEEIRATNALLDKTESDRQGNRSLLRLVINNINNRKRIVTTLDDQITLINREVNAKAASVRRMERELAELKADYAVMVRAAYKSQQTNNVLAFLFAARDFNDMTRRIFYIKRYTAMRERKAEQIDSLSNRLRVDIASLDLKRDSLGRTVQARKQELTKLDREEKNYRRIDSSLSSQARGYRNKIAQQQRQMDALNSRIKQLIAEQARKSQATPRTAAEEEAFVLLTGRFDQNRGKLPYPVGGGVIIERYGTQRHPTERNVTLNNPGLKFATERGAPVRAVFDGQVTQVFLMPGVGNTVIIQHGEYYTAYSNLETVAVKSGSKVSIHQMIGKVYSGPETENHILQFSIWHGKSQTDMRTLNPELWLKR